MFDLSTPSRVPSGPRMDDIRAASIAGRAAAEDARIAALAAAIVAKARADLLALPAIASTDRGASCPHECADDLGNWSLGFLEMARGGRA